MNFPDIQILHQIAQHASTQHSTKPAIVDFRISQQYSYRNLLDDVVKMKSRLLAGQSADLNQARIAFLLPSGYAYVVTQLSIWAAGGIAVPLCTTHPLPDLLYTVTNSQSTILVAHEIYEKIAREVTEKVPGIEFILIHDSELGSQNDSQTELPLKFIPFDLSRGALIIYTSGTTARPKGVVITHSNLSFQIRTLVDAWKWSETDRILHVLPLHHVHGIVNALNCALWIGAVVEMIEKFDAGKVWERWMENSRKEGEDISVFMAVPTVYSKLIQKFDTLPSDIQNTATSASSKIRLMISGSASLPTPLRNHWYQITQQVLLERYGMTEIGMALSHPYDTSGRKEGTVGFPLPGVEVRLIGESGELIEDKEKEGEVQVRSEGVFKEYWGKPDETIKEFTEDGWFKTGDIATRVPPEGQYKILGRRSVDIIKSGGYKISALEVERELLSHPNIVDVAAVGVDNEEWGQRVGAVIVMREGTSITLTQLREYFKPRMAAYKIPTLIKIIPNHLPRNAMGKVNKKELVKVFLESDLQN